MKPRRSTSIASAVLLVVLAAACGPDGAEVGPAPDFTSVDLRAEPAAALPDVGFVDVTEEAGVAFRHVTGAFGEKYLPEKLKKADYLP